MIQAEVTHIAYADTLRFSKLVVDYLSDAETLRPFYQFKADKTGIAKAIESRKQFDCDRAFLVKHLLNAYKHLPEETAVTHNIKQIAEVNTFSVCTAHQPNLFTGPLYFIYKIQHAIQLAKSLNELFPDCYFVPVYYMGSEDADLQELGRVFFMGKWFQWETIQTGAVGRMLVDAALLTMIDEMEKSLGNDLGKKEIELFRKHYQLGKTIAAATFSLVHELFGAEGLLIFDADDAACKRKCIQIFRDDLFHNKSHVLVKETIESLSRVYSIQTSGRDINLFYLYDGVRARIERTGQCYMVQGTDEKFTDKEIEQLLIDHPERFSPNVILRPLVQEKLLPNVAFIGGGSELAYWMELKSTFHYFEVPFPVLILRNSFGIVSQEAMEKVAELNLDVASLFKDKLDLEQFLLERNGVAIPNLNEEKAELQAIYEKMKVKANAYEKTLYNHVDALAHKSKKRIIELEKKMLRQEKKNQVLLIEQGFKCKEAFFPNGVLQERYENYFSLCINYGEDLKNTIKLHQQPFAQTFTIIALAKNS